MGWASGSRLFGAVITSLKQHVDDEESRQAIYFDLIQDFEDEDWDTQDECKDEDPAFDAALRELHPDWFGDGR